MYLEKYTLFFRLFLVLPSPVIDLSVLIFPAGTFFQWREGLRVLIYLPILQH